MTETTPRPSAEEMRAALATLVAGWRLVPADAPAGQEPDDDEDGPYAEGEDPLSVHARHVRTRRCYARGCYALSRYRVRPWCLHKDGVGRAADKGDPAVNDHGMVQLGDSIQWHSPVYACTTQHARELIEADQAARTGGPLDALSAARTHYQVDAWHYEPDSYDVPGALHPLLQELQSAARWVRYTIAAKGGVGAGADLPPGESAWQRPEWTFSGALERLAAVLHLVGVYQQEEDEEALAAAVDLAVDEVGAD